MITIVQENGTIRNAVLQSKWKDENNEEIMVVKLRNERRKNNRNKPVMVSGITLQFESAAQAARELFPGTNLASSAAMIRKCCRGEIDEMEGCRFQYRH